MDKTPSQSQGASTHHGVGVEIQIVIVFLAEDTTLLGQDASSGSNQPLCSTGEPWPEPLFPPVSLIAAHLLALLIEVNDPPFWRNCFTIDQGRGGIFHPGGQVDLGHALHAPAVFIHERREIFHKCFSLVRFFQPSSGCQGACIFREHRGQPIRLRLFWKTPRVCGLPGKPCCQIRKQRYGKAGDVSSIPASSRHMFSNRMYAVYVPYIMYMWISHMRRQVLMVSSKFWRSS